MYKLAFAPPFVKRYRGLSAGERKLVDGKLEMLAENPWHPSLRVKKIQGTGEFECSVNMDIRMAFVFEDGTIIVLLDIDHHDRLLRRRSRRSG